MLLARALLLLLAFVLLSPSAWAQETRDIQILVDGAPRRALLVNNFGPGQTAPERWLSGRKHRTRNAAYLEGYRGFESHPLRQSSWSQLYSEVSKSTLRSSPCGSRDR